MGLYRDVLSGDVLDESSLSEAGAFPDHEALLVGCMASAWRLDDLAMLCVAEFAYYVGAFDVAPWRWDSST
ncbi:MAG: hypothetical protein Q4A07_12020 [Coriobacteriales bacterium]|nr:hypothetical protein [Coriobacteriales bacterium]